MTLQQIWIAFQGAELPPPISEHLEFDNPFLVNYVVYHHYRSLGWVVKGGIKFCVDYLLYKRGPVFTHAEYAYVCKPSSGSDSSRRLALVVMPVYEDPADQTASTFDLQNSSPFGWSWLSTINRVNSQVQKVACIHFTNTYLITSTPDTHSCVCHHSRQIAGSPRGTTVTSMPCALLGQGGGFEALHTGTHA